MSLLWQKVSGKNESKVMNKVILTLLMLILLNGCTSIRSRIPGLPTSPKFEHLQSVRKYRRIYFLPGESDKDGKFHLAKGISQDQLYEMYIQQNFLYDLQEFISQLFDRLIEKGLRE